MVGGDSCRERPRGGYVLKVGLHISKLKGKNIISKSKQSENTIHVHFFYKDGAPSDFIMETKCVNTTAKKVILVRVHVFMLKIN